jgi:hypothetical protein
MCVAFVGYQMFSNQSVALKKIQKQASPAASRIIVNMVISFFLSIKELMLYHPCCDQAARIEHHDRNSDY